MNISMLVALVLAFSLLTIPVPSTEVEEWHLGPGDSITYEIDSAARMHLAYTARSSDGPFDIALSRGGEVVVEDHGTFSIKRSMMLPEGKYVLTITNGSPTGNEVDLWIHIDHEVLGGLTAKNLLVIGIAGALGIVAAVRLARRR